ncbi:MAG: hypothetical protein IPL32_19155 [Chloracidobacterium sp.]|nr:hypothetical protein [Chloracidobacterium sp.]
MRTLTLTLLVAVLAVPLLMFGAARAVGYEARSTADDGPRIPKESTGELLAHAVRGCVEGGGQSSTGIQAGVVLARCTPAALPHLGVEPIVRRAGR